MQYSNVMSPWTGRARVRWPGVPALPPGVERYRVAGGGVLVFHVEAGDKITLVDVEGHQAGELVAFVDGKPDPGVLSAPATGTAEGVKAIAARRDSSSRQLRREIERRGLNLGEARSVDLFGRDSKPGEQTSLSASGEAIVIVAAPGGPMAVDQQDPPSDLTAFVHRAAPGSNRSGTVKLPDPLADPLDEVRVDRATARAYEVRAGDYIQIIDVEGRQCSDFQAFSKADLERGVERCVDVTTTRALMGQGYPAPGNHAKYYDQDFQPLVEIVQDYTVRHDAFSLACNPKYYEDMGYFGHTNCTDNFNGELEPYQVAPRRGWMSMNFFFNTAIDETNQLVLDEPWSRPGDYVLLKALTDLVCVSSACPDDIDPANGWNPTDIHVRTYSSDLAAKRVIAFRKRTDAEAEMTKETGFHPRTSALTRNFAPYQGYWLASSYINHGAVAEYWACREKAAMMDMSPLRKFEVVGPDAEALLQYCLTRDVRRLATGQISYTAMCYDTGTMVDDGTVFRLGPDNFRWICGSDYGGERVREQAEALGLQAWVKSSTDQLHNVSVQGPNSRAILQEIVWTPPTQPRVDELKWFRFTIGRLHHHDGTPVLVSRTGFTGELGFEVFCHPTDACTVWDAIAQAGEPHGVLPMGLDALDMLRQEAGLIFAGHEFDDQTDPYEAGIGFTVPLQKKNEDFIGRSALESRKANPQRKLVGLELEGDVPAGHGDCVHVGRQQVGVVTSGTRSPVLRKTIALCRMAVQYAEPDTQVEVGKLDGHQKRLPARVVKYPFYKRENPGP
jgi:aminomethyltransferase